MKKLLWVVFFGLTVSGCHSGGAPKNADGKHETIVTVQKNPSVTRMFYNGSIKPIKVNTITSPVDGEVGQMNFNYGQIVQKGQLLVKIRSDKLQNEFHEAVSSYLKSKESYNNSKVSFDGTSQLYKEKIVSRQEYTQEKTQLENSEMSYLDAKFKLEELIKSVPGLDKKVKKIELDDIKNIRTIFEERFDEIALYAHQTGIVLFPVKKSNSENDNKELEVGGEVKKGQGLLSVGNLSSLGVVFDAGEMEINKLNPGQPVKVTTPAIPEMVLNGKIYSVAVQATNSQGYSESAKFPVKVKVDHISDKLQKLLRVGMSVRVEVDLEKKLSIAVPLKAIKKHHGHAEVKVYDSNKKESHWTPVKTGATSLSDINIVEGLKAGESVIVDH